MAVVEDGPTTNTKVVDAEEAAAVTVVVMNAPRACQCRDVAWSTFCNSSSNALSMLVFHASAQLVKQLLHHHLKAVELGGEGLELGREVLNRTRHLLLELGGGFRFRARAKNNAPGTKISHPIALL
jgi:hypothetical protein